MVKASALYIVIVITLVIGIICSSFIVVAYFYREQYQRAFRYEALQNNLGSGINILLADKDEVYKDGKRISLFGEEADSVELKTTAWGVYVIGTVRAFRGQDTLSKAFSIAHAIDSTKWAALYLPDEDRPVSVSGKTLIKGNVFLPKSGVRQAYVDGKSYQGDKRLVIGKTFNSQKTLPPLNESRLNQLEKYFELADNSYTTSTLPDSLSNSFLASPKIISIEKKVVSLDQTKLAGNIIVVSDTSIIIGGEAKLKNILVFAPYIQVKKGFKGSCQLFATDSIRIEADCTFNYPSALGVLKFRSTEIASPATMNIGENVNFSGCILAYDKSTVRGKQPIINLGKKANISGQIYITGVLGLNDDVVVNGSIFTGRFLYRSGFTVFENYIINTSINADMLSPYYLTSDIMPVATRKKRILQWIE